MFVDRVHDRAIFEIKDVSKWVAEFRAAVQGVLGREEEALTQLQKAGKDKRARDYFASIRFRLHLCGELVRRREIADALASWEKNMERKGDVTDLVELAEGHVPRTVSFPPPSPGTIESGEVHVYWEFARFVKHKMLFIVVELRHEAGPFFKSTEDHLALVRKAWRYAHFFREVCEKASSPLMAQSEFGIRIEADCLRIVTELAEVVNRLTEYRKNNYDVSREELVNEEAVTTELKQVSNECVNILANAAQIEHALAEYATAELKSAWARALRSAVLTERRTFPASLFAEPESATGPALTEALSTILEELEYIEDPKLIETWLYHVLDRGMALPEQGVSSELGALALFRRLVQIDPVAAQQMHWRIVSEAWLAPPLRSSAALILTGALTAAVGSDSVAENLRQIDWKGMAQRTLSGQIDAGLEEDDRIAVAAGLFVSGVVCWPDEVMTAKRVAQDFRSLLEAAPETGRQFFAQHFADALEQHMNQEKKKHFLKLVALDGVLHANDLLWPDKTPAVDAVKQRSRQWAEIRDLSAAM